jgi:DNA-binding IclR family transcriptional regulator
MPATKKTRTRPAETPAKGRGDDRYLSRAVGKAFEALEMLQLQTTPMALNEIATRIQLSKTSTFRLLRTLQSAGYLAANSWGQYFLVPEIRSVVPTQFLVRLLRASTPRMRDLSRELRESVSLAALFENHSEVIAVVESPEVIRMSNVVGHILPPNASSLGKVICAFQPEPRREKLLRSYGLYRFTPFTITADAALAAEFERIRIRKVATDREESVMDGCCFAVPIFGEADEVAAAISTSIPKVRLAGDEHERQMVEALRATAAHISKEILASGPGLSKTPRHTSVK